MCTLSLQCHHVFHFRFSVILSIENHCSIRQQQTMVTIMTEVFGDKLYLNSVDEKQSCLLSPESLKGRILIKVSLTDWMTYLVWKINPVPQPVRLFLDKGRFSRDLLPVFSGGCLKQFWQWRSLIDVVIPQLAMVLHTPHSALKDGFGEADVVLKNDWLEYTFWTAHMCISFYDLEPLSGSLEKVGKKVKTVFFILLSTLKMCELSIFCSCFFHQ